MFIRAMWPIRPDLISVSVLGDYSSDPDGMLVHRRATPSIKFTGTNLYAWLEREAHRELRVWAKIQGNVPGQGSNANRSIRRRTH